VGQLSLTTDKNWYGKNKAKLLETRHSIGLS